MKQNKLVLFLLFIISVLMLSACSANDEVFLSESNNNNDDVVQLDVTTPDRKIIYSAEATLYVNDIEQTVDEIRLLLEADEWFDSENVSEYSGYLTVRVKTENLDDVIAAIKSTYDVTNYSKSATDISLEYQSTEHKIESYQAERAQLVILYAGASLSDMITINSRIAEIDLELGELEGTLSSFDSLVDYSKITLSIRLDNVVSRLPFGTRIVDGFVNGFNGLISFFDGLIIIIVTLIPFAVVFIPGGYGIYRWYKHYTNKKKSKNHPIE
ncbi:MAG: DUF4349 domain-containing protein [Firmicutes bacterium]|nr:DUF4349 domain-containing protein [Bacillota bacterium]